MNSTVRVRCDRETRLNGQRPGEREKSIRSKRGFRQSDKRVRKPLRFVKLSSESERRRAARSLCRL